MVQIKKIIQIIAFIFLYFHAVLSCSCGKNSVIDDSYIAPSRPNPQKPTIIPAEKKRTPQQCQEYKTTILASLPNGAKNEDPNFVMTGQICADGLGSLYIA